jgi:hypothetical protein
MVQQGWTGIFRIDHRFMKHLSNSPDIRIAAMSRKDRLGIGKGEVRIGDHAVGKAPRIRAIGDLMEPPCLPDRIGRVMLRLHMNRADEIYPGGIRVVARHLRADLAEEGVGAQDIGLVADRHPPAVATVFTRVRRRGPGRLLNPPASPGLPPRLATG